ncbi:serine hydrolase domain-containing protein [Cohnella rhizosphaerae]|uniref:Beta-lactamase family protein n=1 Tax=Cohnella rhizosphaerae TaxID=1457232 RepID=A0A9X4QSH7_9BACL|nr:serine hydrolase [Cohnella rhizosphaerae]MDG0808572.1 beta-lactamase family protein [Cohnella rhizosphaerae]
MDNVALPRSAPEAQGIRSADLLAFLDRLEDSGEIHTFMLLRRGTVIAEGGWKPYSPQRLRLANSVSKSFTSACVGIAADEGLLTVRDKVLSFFPEYAPERPDERLAAMTVEHLLTMSSGHQTDTSPAMMAEEDWVRAFLSLPVEHTPGSVFVYNSGATYMLSAIVQRLTGQPLLEYARTRLFEPLGIHGVTWETCPKGITVGGWGLSANTEHFAKLGQLYLNKGTWQGRRILSEQWIEASTGKRIENGSDPDSDWHQGYGYQFWQCRYGAYRGDGAFGQFIIVLPEQDTVLAITSGVNDMQSVMRAIWEGLLPALNQEKEAIDLSAGTSQALADRLASLHIAVPSDVSTGRRRDDSSGVRYRLEDNPLGLTEVELREDEQGGCVVWTQIGQERILNYSCTTWTLNEWKTPDGVIKISASGGWTDEKNFLLAVRPIETAFVQTYRCRFEGDTLIINYNSEYDLFGPKQLTLEGKAVTEVSR